MIRILLPTWLIFDPPPPQYETAFFCRQKTRTPKTPAAWRAWLEKTSLDQKKCVVDLPYKERTLGAEITMA